MFSDRLMALQPKSIYTLSSLIAVLTVLDLLPPEKPVVDDYPDICPECGGAPKKDEKGDLVCERCGLVVLNALDTGRDYRVFDDGDTNRIHEGPPATVMRHDRNLPTEIGFDRRDAHGKPFPSSEISSINRMRRTHRRARIQNSQERNLVFALLELDKIASHLDLPEVIRQRGAVLYRKCLDKGMMRGRTIESVVGGCIYVACKEQGVPRTLDEVVKYVPRTGRKELGRVTRLIGRALGLKTRLPMPVDYVDRFATSLDVPSECISLAKKLLVEAEEKGLVSGRVPTGIAAASIYLACVRLKIARTQREISDVCGVTEVTIRNRYRELKEYLEEDEKHE